MPNAGRLRSGMDRRLPFAASSGIRTDRFCHGKADLRAALLGLPPGRFTRRPYCRFSNCQGHDRGRLRGAWRTRQEHLAQQDLSPRRGCRADAGDWTFAQPTRDEFGRRMDSPRRQLARRRNAAPGRILKHPTPAPPLGRRRCCRASALDRRRDHCSAHRVFSVQPQVAPPNRAVRPRSDSSPFS